MFSSEQQLGKGEYSYGWYSTSGERILVKLLVLFLALLLLTFLERHVVYTIIQEKTYNK
jgi:hypothetical protein